MLSKAGFAVNLRPVAAAIWLAAVGERASDKAAQT